ncbi:glycoside hydrolase family 57 protein [Prochlorococcus sp. MIT 0916]|uniref:glycoside hydrolase family 57 protein n=1 Tax=Prochlorococcus sp. MIT 0916 TaxID=3082521 RepID=UPI0039B44AC2
MTKGNLAIVLHAHLPYVRSEEPGSLEEDWFFQALVECYLPLLETLEEALRSKDQEPKITIGLSPTLLSLLEDEVLKNRFEKWVAIRLEVLNTSETECIKATLHLRDHLKRQLDSWKNCRGDLIGRFKKLETSEVIDILTCAATHGYLPLLRENPEAVRAQLKTAVREHQRLFMKSPLGIWLPECAYYEGLDELMAESGLRYAVLDGHGLLNADPRPRYGLYAPICTRRGVAFFGRDSESTLPVWSAKDGYPGNPNYREFHRDLGWDLPIEELRKIGINEKRPLGIKLFKISSKNTSLEKKQPYDPQAATESVEKDAENYLKERKKQLIRLEESMQIEPLLIAPFDAELFGHWWFEGPKFLSNLFIQSKKEGIKLITLKEALKVKPQIQLCNPSPSSWGQGGFHNYWLNKSNAWIVNEWSKAGREMISSCSEGLIEESNIKIIKQAGRELLLSQSSDWSFILKAGTTTELARERINLHLKRFWMLINTIKNKSIINSNLLEEIEKEDCIFPLISPIDWKKKT